MTTTITPTDTPLSALLKTAARIATTSGCTVSTAIEHVMGKMATERPQLLGKVLAEMAQRPEFTAHLDDLLAAGDDLAAKIGA